MPTMGSCPVCGTVTGHSLECGSMARAILAKVLILAAEAEMKGENLQRIPELKLVGNAYVGMAQRIYIALETEKK